MSIVIVGGHDRMVGQYKKICKSYKFGLCALAPGDLVDERRFSHVRAYYGQNTITDEE